MVNQCVNVLLTCLYCQCCLNSLNCQHTLMPLNPNQCGERDCADWLGWIHHFEECSLFCPLCSYRCQHETKTKLHRVLNYELNFLNISCAQYSMFWNYLCSFVVCKLLFTKSAQLKPLNSRSQLCSYTTVPVPHSPYCRTAEADNSYKCLQWYTNELRSYITLKWIIHLNFTLSLCQSLKLFRALQFNILY